MINVFRTVLGSLYFVLDIECVFCNLCYGGPLVISTAEGPNSLSIERHIYHDVGDLAFCRSQCFPDLFLHKVGQILPELFKDVPKIKWPRHTSEHSYSELS